MHFVLVWKPVRDLVTQLLLFVIELLFLVHLILLLVAHVDLAIYVVVVLPGPVAHSHLRLRQIVDVLFVLRVVLFFTTMSDRSSLIDTLLAATTTTVLVLATALVALLSLSSCGLLVMIVEGVSPRR